MESSRKEIAKMYKALCDENRVTILEIVRNGECCACKLLDKLKIGQPTLSHHMKILMDSGMVSGRKEGRWMYYSINEEGVSAAIEYLNGYLD